MTTALVATDWRGDVIALGMRVTVCAGSVDGFPQGLVTDVRGGSVEVLLDCRTYPAWFRGEQLVIDDETTEEA